MITHYALGKRALASADMLPLKHKDAFLIGVQGPDIFYFLRAYPWLPGKKGLPIGNALHEVEPSRFVNSMREAVEAMPARCRDIANSYALGVLSHYAADRCIHPFVTAMQRTMKEKDPSFAADENPYHYRIESALDTHMLRADMGQYVTSFSLRSLVPSKDADRDEAIALFWHHVIKATLATDIPMQTLKHLTEDMRHSMGLMTDRSLIKGHLFRLVERFQKKGAWYSALLRTPEVEWYDFTNRRHTVWRSPSGDVTTDFFDLCQQAVALSTALILAWENGEEVSSLTDSMDFTGYPYTKEDNL